MDILTRLRSEYLTLNNQEKMLSKTLEDIKTGQNYSEESVMMLSEEVIQTRELMVALEEIIEKISSSELNEDEGLKEWQEIIDEYHNPSNQVDSDDEIGYDDYCTNKHLYEVVFDGIEIPSWMVAGVVFASQGKNYGNSTWMNVTLYDGLIPVWSDEGSTMVPLKAVIRDFRNKQYSETKDRFSMTIKYRNNYGDPVYSEKYTKCKIDAVTMEELDSEKPGEYHKVIIGIECDSNVEYKDVAINNEVSYEGYKESEPTETKEEGE